MQDMPRKLGVRQNPAMSMFGGVFGLVFVIIGLVVVIPTFGAFGVLWTVIAAVGAGMSFYNALSPRGVATEIIELSDDAPMKTSNVEQRLRSLDDLKRKDLVSEAEYQSRRAEILRSI